MILEIPQGAKKLTLKDGFEIEVPDGAKTLEIPDNLLIPEQKQETQKADFEKDFEEALNKPEILNRKIEPPKNSEAYNKLVQEDKPIEGQLTPIDPFIEVGVDAIIGDETEKKEKSTEVLSHIQNVQFANKDLTDMIKSFAGDEEALKTIQDKAMQTNKAVADTLYSLGFDGVVVDGDGEVKFKDDDGSLKVVGDSFWEGLKEDIANNKFEISGDILGGIAGNRLTKKYLDSVPSGAKLGGWRGKVAEFLGTLGGAALGAFAGRAADVENSKSQLLNMVDDLQKATNLKEVIEQNPTLQKALDGANMTIYGTAITSAVAEPIIKVGGKIIKLPKEAKDYIVNGNINGAREILKKDSGIDEAFIDEALEQAVNSYKEVGEYSKKGITGKAKQQEELLATAQKDKRFGSALIHDTVLDNQDAAISVSKTIDKRAKDTIKTFEDVSISGSDVKNSVNNYESKVHNQYTQMRDTFREAFKESDLKFNFRNMGIDSKISTALDDIIDPYQKETAENLRQKINKAIDNTKTGTGVSREIDNLIELRQSINEFYGRNQKNFKHDHKKLIIDLKQTLDDELEKAVREKLQKEAQKPMIDMFENAIKDYREMFEIQDTKLYKSLMNDGKNADDRLKGLINHTADDEKEFETLLKKLPFEDQQKIENSIVGKFVNDNIIGKSNELQVVDYKKVSDGLEKLEEFFVTDSGKDSIKLMKDMALKYGDDFDLLRAATQAGVDTNAGIATTIKGRIEYKLAKGAYDRIMRLVPFSNSSKRLALQNHIAQALEKSRTPIELARKVIVSPDIPQGAKQDLREIIAEHTRVQKIKNEEDALEYEKAQGEKEYLKRKQEQKINDEIENFTTPSIYEIRAVETHTPDDRFGSFSQMTTKIAKGTATPHEVEQYVKAKNKIEPEILEKTTLKNQYPVNSTAIEKLEELKSFDSTKVNEVLNDNEYKSLIRGLKDNKLPNTTKEMEEKYRQKFYELNKLYDEAKELIDANKKAYDGMTFEEAEKAGLVPFANGQTLGGAFFGGSETAFNERDWNSDGEVDAEDVALGAIGGAIGFKALAKLFPNWFKNETGTINANKLNKERKNIVKVAMGEKPSTAIKTYDVESLDDFVELERGGFNKHTQKGVGFEKIAIRHMQDGSDGFITLNELTQIGNIIRNGKFELKKNGLREYTYWDNDIRYKAIVGENDKNERVVSFYSNRRGKGHNARTLFDNPSDREAGARHNAQHYTFSTNFSDGIIITYKPQKTFKEWINSLETNDNGVVLGAFSGKSPIVKKDFKDEDGFYSVLEKVVDEKVGGKIDTVSLTKMLEKNGVKEDELEWSGLKELIENNDKLTKEQIEETIKENRLEIETVTPVYQKYEDYKLKGGENYIELLFTAPKLNSNYTSRHWEESNILAFARVDNRAIDDKKTLFIEELQSDWHQDGRKKGYKTGLGLLSIVKKDNKYFVATDGSSEKIVSNGYDNINHARAILSEMSEQSKVPNAPFKKNWAELGLKRMIQEAVVNDYDKIAWTTGQQQAKRYSLEKELDTIVYNKQTGYIQGSKDGDEVVFKKVASDEEVEAMLGKELTKRLIDPKSSTTDEIYVLKGDELKFGGDGMKAFYDNIVPNIAKKLFKKYKVKPKMEELDDIEEMVWSVDITPQMKEDIKKYGQPLYMKEETVGAVAGGMANFDEEDPESFVLGMIYGAAGVGGVKTLSPLAKKYYNKYQKGIPQKFLKDATAKKDISKVKYISIGKDNENFQNAMSHYQKELNGGQIETLDGLENIYMSFEQYKKLDPNYKKNGEPYYKNGEDRSELISYIKPTAKDPNYVIDFENETWLIKFIKDGKKVEKISIATIDKNNELYMKTLHDLKGGKLFKIFNNGKIKAEKLPNGDFKWY